MIRVVLVDDEEYALDMLEILLGRIGNVMVVGKYKNAVHAIEDMRTRQVDAVFLDIEMPGMKGNEAARAIKAIDAQIHIIFTTAYTEYAIEAFEIKALDYLLKPLHMDRLQESVKRIEAALPPPSEELSTQPVISCMGDFSVQIGDVKWSWRTTKEKELCAFLVHHGGQTVDQAVIMEALWPETDLEKARSYLYTSIWQLKKNIRANGSVIAFKKISKGYSLDIGHAVCDVTELEMLLNQILNEDHVGNRQQLDSLSNLFKGDYLSSCDFRWAMGRQEQLLSKYVQALRKLFVYFKENSHLPSSLDCLERLVAVSPDSEKDGRELIKLHIEAGNRNEALKAYWHLEKSVHDRMGVEVEEETEALYRQLVSADASLRSVL